MSESVPLTNLSLRSSGVLGCAERAFDRCQRKVAAGYRYLAIAVEALLGVVVRLHVAVGLLDAATSPLAEVECCAVEVVFEGLPP